MRGLGDQNGRINSTRARDLLEYLSHVKMFVVSLSHPRSSLSSLGCWILEMKNVCEKIKKIIVDKTDQIYFLVLNVTSISFSGGLHGGRGKTPPKNNGFGGPDLEAVFDTLTVTF